VPGGPRGAGCFHSSSYEEVVLKAIKLGEDTDTTGCVTGGLAGSCYGIGSIRHGWIDSTARKAEVKDVIERFGVLMDGKAIA
jgi:ADP-ribosyl-[dinitrogen reductase] hydrolase